MHIHEVLGLKDLLAGLAEGSLTVGGPAALDGVIATSTAALFSDLCSASARSIDGGGLAVRDWRLSRSTLWRGQMLRPEGGAVNWHRIAAMLAGGCGVRPASCPSWRWESMGGNRLEVAVVFTVPGFPRFRPLICGHRRHVPVKVLVAGDLTDEDLVRVLRLDDAERGVLLPDLLRVQRHLRSVSIPIFELTASGPIPPVPARTGNLARPGLKRAPTAEPAGNATATQPSKMRRVMLLARRWGFDDSVTPELFEELLARVTPRVTALPVGAPAARCVVESAVAQVTGACLSTMSYLRDRGLVSKCLMPRPAAIEVLLHMAARFPAATQNDFAGYWLALTSATGRYRRRERAQGDIAAIHRAPGWTEARAALLARMGSASPQGLDRQTLTSRGRRADPGLASLYAQACVASTVRVVDLADPDRVFPFANMELVDLWPGSGGPSLASCAVATADTARILAEHGGWTRAAYHALRPARSVLDSQRIPIPPASDAGSDTAALVKARGDELADMIGAFLVREARRALPGIHSGKEFRHDAR
ncbi:hypothetical protein [Longispora albida]|uniref:hypothetical protein n=1 Tax=Longispora albida TaxID=203523 RepID=UPI000399ABBE|nr:hypothetical protein [Longispora albida]